jgi:hypothetical protein
MTEIENVWKQIVEENMWMKREEETGGWGKLYSGEAHNL